MKKWLLHLPLAAALAGALLALPGAARADRGSDLDHIAVRYHGGRLMQHVRVATLFWGKEWDGSPVRDYLNRFFRDLFADGRYMANLSQYSAGGYQIGNGSFAATVTDSTSPPGMVTDAQIQGEIAAQIAAGRLPTPDDDMLLFVFTPPHVRVVDPSGREGSVYSYHSAYGWDGAYAVVPCWDDHYPWQPGDPPQMMTAAASHELAAAVTNPDLWGGWSDERNGEIADIPWSLYKNGRAGDFWDVLQGKDGTGYLVFKVWSNRDGEPIRLAPRVELRLTSGGHSYAVGEPITLTATVTNPSRAPVTLRFSSAQQYDFEVQQSGQTVWRWSAGRLFTQALTELTLGPGERQVFTVTWNQQDDTGQPVPAGTYEVRATLTTIIRPRPQSARLRLLIGD